MIKNKEISPGTFADLFPSGNKLFIFLIVQLQMNLYWLPSCALIVIWWEKNETIMFKKQS